MASEKYVPEGLDEGPDIFGESDSECFTEGTPSHSGSDDDDENDSEEDVEVEQRRLLVLVGGYGVQLP